jgi:magnesium chelatase subunit ChlD-like protein
MAFGSTSSGSFGEGVGVEELRENLPRDFGWDLVREQFALYCRVPFARIAETTPEALGQLDRVLERRLPQLAGRTTSAFLIADQDFVELDLDRFTYLLKERQVGPIREAIADSLKGLEGGRDPRLRRILNEMSETRQRQILESIKRHGRSASRLTKSRRGRVVAYHQAPPDGTADVALLPTIRAAVGRGAQIGKRGRLDILRQDIQENVRYTRVGSYMCLVVDTATYDEEVQEQTRSIVQSLLLDAYERRDQVGLVLVRGNRAVCAIDFTTDLELVRTRFLQAPWGGLSPFASGLMEGTKMFLARLADTLDVVRIFAVIGTGTANVPMVQGGNVRRELQFLPNLFEHLDLPPLIVDVTPHGSPFLRQFSQETGGRYYHPSRVRYHRVVLAQELLSSVSAGERDRAAAVGKAFLQSLGGRKQGPPDANPG